MAFMKKILFSSDGMTILEVVLALSMLFFVITAVLGLMVTTNNMSMGARERTTAIDVCASYIEDCRNLPFDDVGVVGGDPAGALAPHTLVNAGNFTVTIMPTVIWVNDPNMPGSHVYKKLTVNATVAQLGRALFTYTTATFIRNLGSEASTSTIPPVCDFGPDTPAGNAPVEGSSVSIDGSATAMMRAGTIAHVNISVDGTIAKDAANGGAIWLPGTEHWDNIGAPFHWSNLGLQDGIRVLTVWADDSMGQQASVNRSVLVDNNPPSMVLGSSFVGTSTSDVNSILTWPAAQDGSTGNFADHYMLTYFRQPNVAPGGGDKYWINWTNDGQTNDWHALSCTKSTPAFSRYAATIQAHSLLNHTSADATMVHAWVSRPTVTGAYFSRTYTSGTTRYRLDTTITSQVTTPNFPATFSRQLYCSLSAAGGWVPTSTVRASGVATRTITKTTAGAVPSTAPDSRYYYRLLVGFKAQGWDANATTQTVWSNILGPCDQSSNATATANFTMSTQW
jgi:hypothetical protein